MGIYFVETGANQRPSTVVYDRDGSSLSLAPPDHFPWREILRPGDWLHVSGITPALSENAAFATRRAVETAKSVGCSVSLDMNFRAKLWRWKPGVSAKELARDTISGLLQSVDLLIGNEEDAESVVGIRAEETEVETGQIHHERYASVAAEIVKRHPNVQQVAFTLRGSVSASHNTWSGMLFQDGETYFAPMIDGQLRPYEITHIVDRVGAGDSFVAGLLFSLMQGRHPQDAIAFATAASCLKHSIPGDYNMSSVADVEALLSGSGSGRVIR